MPSSHVFRGGKAETFGEQHCAHHREGSEMVGTMCCKQQWQEAGLHHLRRTFYRWLESCLLDTAARKAGRSKAKGKEKSAGGVGQGRSYPIQVKL